MKLLFLLLAYISALFASNSVYVPVLSDNNVSKNIYILLSENISSKYNVKWDGNGINIDDILLANGEGNLTWIRKVDNYQSLPQKVNFTNGKANEPLKIHIQFKCIDTQCKEKETKGILTYHIIDENTTKIKKEPYIYRGTLKTKDDDLIYTGEGTIETNSSTYTGELLDNDITGYGEFKTKLNNNLDFQIEQQGLWNNGKFISGYASTVYQDGGIYKGDTTNGIPDGKGIFIWSDKSKYNGFFKNGKKDGYGVYTFKDGSVYAGNYKDDKKDGYGELYIKSKDIYYKGEFKDGVFNGLGELYIQDKVTYIGKFKNNKPHGRGIIIDSNDTTTEVLAYNGTINPMQKSNMSFNILNLFITEAHAGFFSDAWDSVTETVNTISTAITETLPKWFKENKEHLVNAVKGCIAGGVSGAATGALSGASVGTVVGGPGAGTLAGASVGAFAGGLNGCINQGMKAFEISKNNGGHYGWEEAKEAFKEEISLENLAVGAGGVALEAVLTSVKVTQVLSKIPGIKNIPINKESTAIFTRLTSKSPAVQNAIKFLATKGKSIVQKICKTKLFQKLGMCKKQPKSSYVSLVSWNLKNLSGKSVNRDWHTIKNFISSQPITTDVIMLQEIMNKQALQKINSNFKIIISKPKGKVGKKEYFGFLVRKDHKTKLINFRQYSKFRVPPSVLIIDNKIALINVHIVFGDDTLISKHKRIKEVLALNSIIKTIRKKYKINNIIVGGDFNIDFSEKIFKVLETKLWSNKLIVYNNKPTTIGRLSKNRFNKSYDHFISNSYLVNTKVEIDILNNRKQSFFNKQVSDHLPISGIFTFIDKQNKKKK